MKESEFTELSGRIEGVGRAVLQLAALLEERAAIDGPKLSQALRGAVTEPAQEALGAARRTLQALAKELDGARDARKSFAKVGVPHVPCADLLH